MFWPLFRVNAFYKNPERRNFDFHLIQHSKNSILKRHSSDSMFTGENVDSKGYNGFSVTKYGFSDNVKSQ